MINYLLLPLLSLSWLSLFAQPPISLSSPNRSIVLTVRNTPTGEISYQVSYKNKAVIKPSGLGFTFSKPQVSLTRFSLTAVDSSKKDETWNQSGAK